MHPFELARLVAMTAPLREHLAIVPVDRDDLTVRAIGNEDVFLSRVLRKHEIPDRTVLHGLRLDPELLHECAVFAENLDAIIGTVTNVDKGVIGYPDAMYRI